MVICDYGEIGQLKNMKYEISGVTTVSLYNYNGALGWGQGTDLLVMERRSEALEAESFVALQYPKEGANLPVLSILQTS